MADDAIKPFHIDIRQVQLDDLADRLARTRWIDELPSGWERGVPPAYLRELASYWADGFDWRAQEAELNVHPQYTTVIGGQNMHFVHVRSPRHDAIPLLLIHGWPGTPADFQAMAGPLATPPDPGTPAFHLVIPSLPGHGFSGPVTEPGWNDGRVAGALDELMTRLGYSRYGVHGGDHGAFLAPRIGRDQPGHVLGVHVNGLVTFPTGDPADMAILSGPERQRLAAMKQFQDEGSAYMQLAGTRPNTIAQLLADSPAGQLAWIAEKYKEWAGQAIGRDNILTTASIYWLTDTARSVANYYYERFHDPAMFAATPKGTVPTGVAVFSTADFAIRPFAESAHYITRWTEFDSGGHFPALEVPDLLTSDIRVFFGSHRLTGQTQPPPGQGASAGSARRPRTVRRDQESLAALIDRARRSPAPHVELPARLRACLSEWSARNGISAEFEESGAGTVPGVVAEALVAAVGGALANVARHAEASGVRLSVASGASGVQVLVGDDGLGFDASRTAKGHGLDIIAERLEAVGGTVEIQSHPRRGTEVLLRWVAATGVGPSYE